MENVIHVIDIPINRDFDLKYEYMYFYIHYIDDYYYLAFDVNKYEFSMDDTEIEDIDDSIDEYKYVYYINLENLEDFVNNYPFILEDIMIVNHTTDTLETFTFTNNAIEKFNITSTLFCDEFKSNDNLRIIINIESDNIAKLDDYYNIYIKNNNSILEIGHNDSFHDYQNNPEINVIEFLYKVFKHQINNGYTLTKIDNNIVTEKLVYEIIEFKHLFNNTKNNKLFFKILADKNLYLKNMFI